ncbi:Flagellar biosynthesis protein FlhF [Desulfovibrio sp. DV]|uniref:flagellar biosynthesis protein FlhF n=1 Tax=Desulfovibrio sp. DV TaxID=1844708 RepID=UPI00094BAC25|nr:flagellar biosynthesis protein FlhF [Desulfovibrio sp. DV]OLN28043.1 Flagellar biosynthesis protein FlhF [Desulfovibrio sp. DV]
MRVKTFRGENMAAALSQIRQELGKEAVILGSQTVREDGRSLCEVMAALEHPGQSLVAPATAGPACPTRPGNGNGNGKPAPASGRPPQPGKAGQADWNREWCEIKGHLLALMRPRMDLSALSPRQRLALEYLEREGVNEASILAIYRSIIERCEEAVIPALSRIVAVKPLTPQAWPNTAHMFLGPSGVGKTTILLRLALEARRRLPQNRVVVVNADTGRGKGRLLLRHYAELSGLTYAEVDSPEDFGRILNGAAAGDAVFVDTPSLAREGALAAWHSEMGLSGRAGLAAHLVLSPLFSDAQADHYLRAGRCEHVSSLIWTKLDEACNYGSLVNMAHASSLPVSALTFGPELTGNMAAASGKAVWKLLFKHQLPGEYPDADAAAEG